MLLSEVPLLFRREILPLDVTLIQVSPPDAHGFCCLGVAVAAVRVAKMVIAQVNPRMPRTHGDSLIHVNRLHALVEHEAPLFELRRPALTATDLAIGRHVAILVEDGATLQVGMDSIPDAVLAALTGHKDLGIHTEMFSDGVLDVVERGVITGASREDCRRVRERSRRLYDFVDDTSVIRRNPKVTAINSAIEVGLTGQVCADSIGEQLFSGVGGQMDFIRGPRCPRAASRSSRSPRRLAEERRASCPSSNRAPGW